MGRAASARSARDRGCRNSQPNARRRAAVEAEKVAFYEPLLGQITDAWVKPAFFVRAQ
jgi:hypothetical protein